MKNTIKYKILIINIHKFTKNLFIKQFFQKKKMNKNKQVQKQKQWARPPEGQGLFYTNI